MVPFSTCPSCKGRSYSAAVQNSWRCPYCGILVKENLHKGVPVAVTGNVYKLPWE